MACFRFATGVANSWSIDSRARRAQADCGGQDLCGKPACGEQVGGERQGRRAARLLWCLRASSRRPCLWRSCSGYS
jgi:hypothetical protein